MASGSALFGCTDVVRNNRFVDVLPPQVHRSLLLSLSLPML